MADKPSDRTGPTRSEKPEKEVQEALRLAREAREHAYAPYSGFAVGAAVLAASGTIYAGCNVENVSLGATVCAERTAILRMVAAEGAQAVHLLAVVTDASVPTPPCALCLQVLAEFAVPECEVLLCEPHAVRERWRFSELLPRPFAPENGPASRPRA